MTHSDDSSMIKINEQNLEHGATRRKKKVSMKMPMFETNYRGSNVYRLYIKYMVSAFPPIVS